MNIGLAAAVSPKVTVTSGATYEIFYDYMCTKPADDGVVFLTDSSAFVYIKTTTADGSNTSITKLLITCDGYDRELPTFTVTVGYGDNATQYVGVPTGKNEVTVYVPAGVKAATLKGATKAEFGGAVSFYSDPARMYSAGDGEIDISLNQKESVYYTTNTPGGYNEVLDDETVISKTVMARNLTVKIVSNREVVEYNDAAAIYEWTRPYVDYLNNNNYGVFQGDANGNINIGNNVTRYEIATIAVRIMGLDTTKFTTYGTVSFADQIVEWAQPYVRAAVSAGIISGSLDVATGKLSFNGNNPATREQVMKILVSMCMLRDGIVFTAEQTMDTYYATHKTEYEAIFNSYEFADANKISEWAKPYVVYAVARYNLVGGSPDGGKLYINPTKNITRAEIAKMVACYLDF